MPHNSKTSRRETTSEQRAAVLALRRAGISFGKISAQEGIPKSTVIDIYKRAQLHPDKPYDNKPRSGCPLKVSVKSQRKLCRYAEANPYDTIQALTILSKSGHKLSHCTVRIILRKYGI